MVAVLNWGLAHWWILFLLSALGFFEGVQNFFAGIFDAALALGDRRHERRLDMAQARAAAAGQPVPVALPRPGRCVHRNIKQVRNVSDELVGWLCASCDTQLPADWAIAQEDL
jgi:hypothetical protein